MKIWNRLTLILLSVIAVTFCSSPGESAVEATTCAGKSKVELSTTEKTPQANAESLPGNDKYIRTNCRPVHGDAFKVDIDGQTHNTHVVYSASATFRASESANGGAGGRQHCSVRVSHAHFDRILYVSDSSGHSKFVVRKYWYSDDKKDEIDGNCDAYIKNYMAGLQNSTLGTYDSWKATIEGDIAEIKQGNW